MSDKITRDIVSSAVCDAATDCVKRFQANPYSYLYEADLQADLGMELRRRLPGSFRIKAGELGEIDLSYVYLEYLKYDLAGARLDIAVLDPDRAPRATLKAGESSAHFLYNLGVWVGIELKYCKLGDPWGIEKIREDLSNLTENLARQPDKAAMNGLAIAFIQQESMLDKFCGSIPLKSVSSIDRLNIVYVASRSQLRQVVGD